MLMSDMPLVSIIVPIYNVEKYLQRCIDSLFAQTYVNIEIVLVDDGSADRSLSICKKKCSAG
ncbi:glycosyltransferase family 2 protein [Lacticaseibacillus rhamnosus]|uniref:glycosyltransferase family 2 protein n=1 Tax=Lacticaseibacillus rhamnosus TaxID=47715 RepID=UPI002988014B|nr:glycosyltransferase [Lacticaseibacillus rhamnosus]